LLRLVAGIDEDEGMGKSFTVLAAGSGQILLALAIVAVGYL